jgi:hypothetical protein
VDVACGNSRAHAGTNAIDRRTPHQLPLRSAAAPISDAVDPSVWSAARIAETTRLRQAEQRSTGSSASIAHAARHATPRARHRGRACSAHARPASSRRMKWTSGATPQLLRCCCRCGVAALPGHGPPAEMRPSAG